MMKRTEQSLFYHFQKKHLAEIPRIAFQLLKEKKQVLMLIARRSEENTDTDPDQKQEGIQ